MGQYAGQLVNVKSKLTLFNRRGFSRETIKGANGEVCFHSVIL